MLGEAEASKKANKMNDIMTVTLSSKKPDLPDNGEFTAGHQATIFEDRATGTFGYRYHGVNYRGEYYETKNFTGFESKQAAMKDALENYNIGTGC